ncbi:MAG TPA: HU family DNA-binding protein [Paludibacter sp.]|nr:HU family DNA-binding protein [Paludibacter sp.]
MKLMAEQTENNKPNISPWLLTGKMASEDIVEMLVELEGLDRETAHEAVHLFLEIMHEKLRKGYKVNLPYGSFYPVFGKRDPITGEAEMTVEFEPKPEILEIRKAHYMERLNNPVLN